MAEENPSQDEKTEEATPERREEFRERGQIAVSREITSVFVLVACVVFFSLATPVFLQNLTRLFAIHFEQAPFRKITPTNVLTFANETWLEVLRIILPLFLVTAFVALLVTMIQTRFNWSWKKLEPDWSRLNPMKGLARMVNMQAVVELLKGLGKMTAVSIVAYLILQSEWVKMPGLMTWSFKHTWAYWGDITRSMVWAVAALMLVIAAGDYLYGFMSLERQMKMTKQEVKEEYKRREADPHVKARLRRLQRELLTRKALRATREATVLITNPTHYSIALKYELGMSAPIVLAKGIDHLALKMREVARELDIPIVENRPLARELYATVEEGQEIPEKLYKVVAEVIRYVFRLKGRPLSRAQATPAPEV